MPGPLPSQAEAQRLHQRLLAGDRTATSALAEAFLQPLIDHLAAAHRRAPADLRQTAAGEAIVSLLKRPASYDPGRMELFAYLRMSAAGDLRNLLAREARHQQGRVDLDRVAHSPDAGKYLGRDDDPSLRLCVAEARDAPPDPVVSAVLASATPQERQAYDLMLAGERPLDIAAKIGLGDGTPAELRAAVKRLTDRMKARVRRARRQT